MSERVSERPGEIRVVPGMPIELAIGDTKSAVAAEVLARVSSYLGYHFESSNEVPGKLVGNLVKANEIDETSVPVLGNCLLLLERHFVDQPDGYAFTQTNGIHSVRMGERLAEVGKGTEFEGQEGDFEYTVAWLNRELHRLHTEHDASLQDDRDGLFDVWIAETELPNRNVLGMSNEGILKEAFQAHIAKGWPLIPGQIPAVINGGLIKGDEKIRETLDQDLADVLDKAKNEFTEVTKQLRRELQIKMDETGEWSVERAMKHVAEVYNNYPGRIIYGTLSELKEIIRPDGGFTPDDFAPFYTFFVGGDEDMCTINGKDYVRGSTEFAFRDKFLQLKADGVPVDRSYLNIVFAPGVLTGDFPYAKNTRRIILRYVGNKPVKSLKMSDIK